MRAAVMHAAGDVRIEDVPDPTMVEPTDAIVDERHDDQVTACERLHIGADVRDDADRLDALLPDVLEGTIGPGRVFDRTVGLDGVPDGYRAVADRESIKVLVKP